MDYYIGQGITEIRQREAVQSGWKRQLIKTALYCCAATNANLIGRIKLALQIRLATLCCSDIE